MMELDYGMLSPRFGRSDFSNYGFAAVVGGYGAQPRYDPGTIISLTMKPSIDSNTIMYMLEAFTVRIQLSLQPPVTNDELITAELVSFGMLPTIYSLEISSYFNLYIFQSSIALTKLVLVGILNSH